MSDKDFATKKDLKEGLTTLETNIQKDIQTLGNFVQDGFSELKSLITALPDKHYLDDKIGELRAETVIKDKRTIKALKHLALIVERNHSLDKADKKDIAIVKDLINSTP